MSTKRPLTAYTAFELREQLIGAISRDIDGLHSPEYIKLLSKELKRRYHAETC
jgi:hypothetical protein